MNKEKMLLDAIEHIANPIAYMQRELEDGYVLDGQIAIGLSRDCEYLKEIARKALRDYSKKGVLDEISNRT